MNYATVGSVFTVLVLVFFLGVVFWAYSSKSKKAFEEAANLVFDDEDKEKQQVTRESSANE